MKIQTLDVVKNECQISGCPGRLQYWMQGTKSDLYHCNTCDVAHRWDGKTITVYPEWIAAPASN